MGSMTKPLTVLFICTHNRCRSVIAEAVANQRYGDRVRAYSAGSQPADEVHPLTLKYLSERGYPIQGLESQSWHDYADHAIDVAITVCDSAAGEVWPLWMGDVRRLHWGMPDPSRLDGDETAVREAFCSVMDALDAKLATLV